MFMKHYAPNRCEPRIEVIMKMGVQWRGLGFGGGVQVGCERRIEVIVEMQKKSRGGGGGSGSVRVNVNEELKFLLKKSGGGGGRVGGGSWRMRMKN